MTFKDCAIECLQNKPLIKEWNRLTGNHLFKVRSPIITAIDQTCNFDPDEKAIYEFLDFVLKYIWMPLIEQQKEATPCTKF